MRTRPALLLIVAACLPVWGCGGGEAPAPQVTKAKAPAAGAAPQDPIANAAHRFLDAVVKGDTPGATRMLTPDAQRQFAASEQGFASPELGAPDFRVGEVRKIDSARAAVQCSLTDQSDEGEMLCLLKKVAEGWRVSGVVYETGPDQPPVIINFEEEEQAPAAPAYSHPGFVGQPPVTEGPARTATRPDTATR
ncbi:MAG: hypothetical protein AAGJ46_03925 [Planctomycetota bacterium]